MADDGGVEQFKKMASDLEFFRERIAHEEDQRRRDLARFDGMSALGLAILAELKLIKNALTDGKRDA